MLGDRDCTTDTSVIELKQARRVSYFCHSGIPTCVECPDRAHVYFMLRFLGIFRHIISHGYILYTALHFLTNFAGKVIYELLSEQWELSLSVTT